MVKKYALILKTVRFLNWAIKPKSLKHILFKALGKWCLQESNQGHMDFQCIRLFKANHLYGLLMLEFSDYGEKDDYSTFVRFCVMYSTLVSTPPHFK